MYWQNSVAAVKQLARKPSESFADVQVVKRVTAAFCL
jgi:hypothetical protein